MFLRAAGVPSWRSVVMPPMDTPLHRRIPKRRLLHRFYNAVGAGEHRCAGDSLMREQSKELRSLRDGKEQAPKHWRALLFEALAELFQAGIVAVLGPQPREQARLRAEIGIRPAGRIKEAQS